MKQILFPTDFSKNSKSGLEFAKEFSYEFASQLILFNSYFTTTSPRRPFLEEGTREDEIIKKLKEFASQDGSDESIPMQYIAKEGFALRNIIDLSKNKRMDLVIVNHNNYFDWFERVFASRLLSICSTSYCPTLVLPKGYEFKHINSILVNNTTDIVAQRVVDRFIRYFFSKNYESLSYTSDAKSLVNSATNEMPIKESTFAVNSLNPREYRKAKRLLKREIETKNPDLFVLVLNQKTMLSQIMENHLLLPIIFELDIPVIVMNQNTLKHRKYNNVEFVNRRALRA